MPYLFEGSDKVIHAGLYAVLGAGLAFGRVRAIDPPPHWLLVLVGMLYGLTDEVHQIFVRGRSPDWADWVADVIGVLCGYLLVMAFTTSSDHGVDASR